MLMPHRITATITSCRCFARRVNVVAAGNVVAARLEKPLSIKLPSTLHGVVFDIFVLIVGRQALF